MENYFALTLQTKPYLKKYLQARYGSPIIFSSNSVLGTILIGLLERPYKSHESKTKIQHRAFDNYDCPLEIYLPKSWLNKYRYGHTLSEHHIITFNKYFENQFEEDLAKECDRACRYRVELKKTLEEFCWHHHIEIDEDITMDALQKKCYRYRKKTGKKIMKVGAEGNGRWA